MIMQHGTVSFLKVTKTNSVCYAKSVSPIVFKLLQFEKKT